MNKKITLTLTENEYNDILKLSKSCTLRPATFCKMIVMEHLKHEQSKKSKS